MPLKDVQKRKEYQTAYSKSNRAVLVQANRDLWNKWDEEGRDTPEEKQCKECLVYFPIDQFRKDRTRKDGRYFLCIYCQRESNKKTDSRKDRRNYQYFNHIRRKFGYTKDQYEKIFLEQNGLCAICGQRQRLSKKGVARLALDHITNQVRGLLCTPCNIAVGVLEGDMVRFENTKKYLDHWNSL